MWFCILCMKLKFHQVKIKMNTAKVAKLQVNSEKQWIKGKNVEMKRAILESWVSRQHDNLFKLFTFAK